MIIQSILDNDLYKFTMQKAVLSYRRNIPVVYNFTDRSPKGKFNQEFAERFAHELNEMRNLCLSYSQYEWLKKTLPFLGEDYLQYLKNYRYDPNEVKWSVHNGNLNLTIEGTWERAILWEVPLMALISELYFQTCDANWSDKTQVEYIRRKGKLIRCTAFSDFGTRRRRSFKTQEMVVEELSKFENFLGTSNVHLAERFKVKPIGTMAHEWIMGISALESLRHANRFALKIWSDIFQGNLGIALTDTFGTDIFFEDFDPYLAHLYDGVRHDSGDPLTFAQTTIDFYKSLNINPKTKTIVFSDDLNPQKVLTIKSYCHDLINCVFGIGTNFTNDFENSEPLKMVIKLFKCNNIPVVKFSDSPLKITGDKDAQRVAKWTFFGHALDQKKE